MKEHIRDYFEGILQIRGGSKELLDWIRNRIKEDGKAKVSKEKKVPNGIDLYLTDQHYLQNLGRKIKEKFSGILKISMRLHTVDKMTSKQLYRVNVLFKPLGFKKGEKIQFQGDEYEILHLGNQAQLKNLKSGAKKMVPIEALERAKR